MRARSDRRPGAGGHIKLWTARRKMFTTLLIGYSLSIIHINDATAIGIPITIFTTTKNIKKNAPTHATA
jgi:hypothetical protein